MKRVQPLGFVVLIGLAAPALGPAVFLTDDPYDRDVVLICSDAPLEYIVTRAGGLKGTVEVDPADVLRAPKARFEIAVDNLKTGLPLRDAHLRGPGWLDSRQFPQIVFELKAIKSPTRPTALEPGRPLSLDIEGELTLRGQRRRLPASLEVTLLPADETTAERLPGDLLRLDARFSFLLSEFGLEIPERAARKVANRQDVQVHCFASTERLTPAE